jgi:hypothetical protein
MAYDPVSQALLVACNQATHERIAALFATSL